MKVAIVGAGIMGRMLAYYALQQGWNVSVFDNQSRTHPKNCSAYAAGLLAPWSEADTLDAVWFSQAVYSLETLWPSLVAALDVSIGFQSQPTWFVSYPDHKASLTFHKEKLSRVTRQNFNVLTLHTQTSITAQHVLEIQNEAIVNPRACLKALADWCVHRGVKWHPESVVQTVDSCAVTAKHRVYRFDWVFDCRGLGAALPALRPVYGELLVASAPYQLCHTLRVLHPHGKLYVFQHVNGDIVIGGNEHETSAAPGVYCGTALQYLSLVLQLVPALRDVKLSSCRSHARPVFTNHAPLVQHQPGLTRINGLYRHGFLLAPSIAVAVIKQLTQERIHDYCTV